mmetsp:Transcript_13376/g.42150  ORF Transcript_13376/g.42150 Transcript_13376/m.42150 type:complete len:290 (+) Transcript_13376:955-1824(+)
MDTNWSPTRCSATSAGSPAPAPAKMTKPWSWADGAAARRDRDDGPASEATRREPRLPDPRDTCHRSTEPSFERVTTRVPARKTAARNCGRRAAAPPGLPTRASSSPLVADTRRTGPNSKVSATPRPDGDSAAPTRRDGPCSVAATCSGPDDDDDDGGACWSSLPSLSSSSADSSTDTSSPRPSPRRRRWTVPSSRARTASESDRLKEAATGEARERCPAPRSDQYWPDGEKPTTDPPSKTNASRGCSGGRTRSPPTRRTELRRRYAMAPPATVADSRRPLARCNGPWPA